MANPFVGEIRMFAGNFAPVGWAQCDGQLLAISQNPAVFSLLGTQYGGNGTTNFALPDLRGRIPIDHGPTNNIGDVLGVENVTLNLSTMPAHSHLPNAVSGTGNQASPANTLWAGSALNQYDVPGTLTPMSAEAINPNGGSQPHYNLMPYLVVNFIIALQGIFPPRN